jgi:hypothetical protein
MKRTISNDWVVQRARRLYQLERESQNYAPVKAKVAVYESPDGRLEIEYRGRVLAHGEIVERPARKPATAATRQSIRNMAPLRPRITRGGRSTKQCGHTAGRRRGRPLAADSLAGSALNARPSGS